MEVIVAEPEPVLLIEKAWLAEEVPTIWLAKVRLTGLKLTTGVPVGGAPTRVVTLVAGRV